MGLLNSVTNAALILDVAIGYVAGKLFWELALAGAHQVGRLSVRLVMRLAHHTDSRESSAEEIGETKTTNGFGAFLEKGLHKVDEDVLSRRWEER